MLASTEQIIKHRLHEHLIRDQDLAHLFGSTKCSSTRCLYASTKENPIAHNVSIGK